MNFTEALSTVELIIMTDDVPLIIGESGIGKSAMMKKIAKENKFELVTIDANLLKEGEIGGLPYVKNGITEYATHYKLAEVSKRLELNENGVLLFIDELNRCEHAVQQELMNLILNREINGYKLDERTKVIAAMNPSNKYDSFEDSNYQVIDMDAAQEDRFVWIELESDEKEWIKWAMKKESNIEEEVLEFISQFPGYLHNPYSKENIKPTPRSWERVSKVFKAYKNNKERYNKEALYNAVKGNVGGSIASDFVTFVGNFKNQILKADNLLSYEYIPFEIKELIEKESHSKLYILSKKLIQILDDSKNEDNLKIFGDILNCYPKDLRLGIMKDIKKDYEDTLYKKLLEEDSFIESFFNIYE